jgi:5'-deoxynucleotidase YfbR-like HD superfamily hydrolase
MKNRLITYSGKEFCPFDPKIDDIMIEDIAHALSNITRYLGHLKVFYSVAQHAVLVSGQVDGSYRDKLKALLHDASEAYLADIPAPIKGLEAFREYRKAEKVLQDMIFEKFGLDPGIPNNIREVDIIIRNSESISFRPDGVLKKF